MLGRETAQKVGYVAFFDVTQPSLIGTPQIHTSFNAPWPDSSEVNVHTWVELDDVVILNG